MEPRERYFALLGALARAQFDSEKQTKRLARIEEELAILYGHLAVFNREEAD